MPHRRLAAQLAALDVALALERDARRRLVLTVTIRDVEARIVEALAQSPNAEPLPQLIARLAQGTLSPDTAGQAIARDPSLAGQVATALSIGTEAQTGDIATGDIAGTIVKVYIGGRGGEAA